MNGVLADYTSEFAHLLPKKIALIIFLMVLVSFTEAIGLLLLFPLIQLVGLDAGQSIDKFSTFILGLFSFLGIQLNLIIVLGIYVLVVSFNALLRRWETILGYEIDYRFAAHLRKRLYHAISSTDWLFFARSKSSHFAHALTNEIERIGTGTSQFLTLIANIMILIVYIIFSFQLAGVITGLIFLAGVILLLFLRNKVYSSRSRGEDITISTRNIYSTIMQHLDGMKTIRSFGLQNENEKVFSYQTDEIVHSYMGSIRSFADVHLLFDIGTVVMLAIIVLILIEIVQISTATLLVLIYIFFRMVPQFSSIQSSYQYVLNMLPAYNNVKNLENKCIENIEIKESESMEVNLKSEVALEEVSFSYPDGHFTLKDLNLKIAAGETTAIAGPSGAGKSTIADLVMGLINPVSGMVVVDGSSIFHGSWRDKIGYVAQETFLFNESVKFNLLLARPEASANDLEEALKLAAAYDFVSKLPEGLDTVIGDRGVRLSGGEKQRIALARALLRKPSILILDEATSNLDSENEKRIMHAIDDLHGEITILIIAHRLSTIKNADYIYLIDNGQVIDSGSWEDLLRNEKGWFWDICVAQGVKR